MNKEKIGLLVLKYLVIFPVIFSIILLFVSIIKIDGRCVFGYELFFGLNSFNFSFLILFIFIVPFISLILIFFSNKQLKCLEFASILLLVAGVFTLVSETILSIRIKQKITIEPSLIVYGVTNLIMCVIYIGFACEKNPYKIKEIVETGMLVGLAIVLDLPWLKIRIGNNGGSISFTILPLVILSLRLGFFKGFIGCGIIYGLITCLIDGWGLYTYPLDYLLAYGSISLIGLFKEQILKKENKYNFKGILFLVIGMLILTASRLTFSTISGIVLYELSFVPSLVYNVVPIASSSGAVLILLILLYKPLLFINKKY